MRCGRSCNSAASSGVGMVGCGLVGGFAYERWAGGAFFLMAVVAAFGALLAVWLRATAPRADPAR